MDIITNLVTTTSATSNQTPDLLRHLDKSSIPLVNEENSSLDTLRGEEILVNGITLPQYGNNTPIVFSFEAALKEINQIQKEEAQSEGVLVTKTGDFLTHDLDKEKDVITQVQIGLVLQQIQPQTEYQIDKESLTQQDEKLTSLLKESIQLKELSNQATTPIELANNTANENAKATPTFQFLNDDVKSSVEKQFDFKQQKLVNKEEEPNPDSLEVIQNQVKPDIEIKNIKFREVKADTAKENINISLKAEYEHHQESEHNLTESSPTEYQVMLGEILHRKNESLTQASTQERVVHRPSFAKDLADNIQLMINTKENSATVDINPPELGKIEIKIVQDADRMHISFLASQHETQSLIEASIDRLKTQVEMHGLNLGNVSVSHQGAEHQQHLARDHRYTIQEKETIAITESNEFGSRSMSPTSMLDIYA